MKGLPILRAESLYVGFILPVAVSAATFDVANDRELREALEGLSAGDVVRIQPGDYRGGIALNGLRGRPVERIRILGADAERPPVFEGGTTAWQLSDCHFVTLENLEVRGYPGNGINVDDGGSIDTPARGIVLRNLRIFDTGPEGNHDGLKLSGVREFEVTDCVIEGWGGSAIDMVGCHDGVVSGCVLRGKEGFSQSNGVQAKGGTSNIVIRDNRFQDPGHRGVNIGGSTGLPYFRPRDARFEASEVTVSNNTFSGGTAPVAFVNSDRCTVEKNLIVYPEKWVCRILQESTGERFPPSQKGVYAGNLVVFDGRVRVFVNIGEGTKPESFVFRGNLWYSSDGSRRPELPVDEEDPHYPPDPQLERDAEGFWRIHSRDTVFRDIGPGR